MEDTIKNIFTYKSESVRDLKFCLPVSLSAGTAIPWVSGNIYNALACI